MALKKKLAESSRKTESLENKAGIFIPGCLLIGLGFGFVFGNVPAGIFIGLGTGLLAYGGLSLGNCCSSTKRK
ncbi:MAG: hypothetical protein V1820_01375 [archaeon]